MTNEEVVLRSFFFVANIKKKFSNTPNDIETPNDITTCRGFEFSCHMKSHVTGHKNSTSRDMILDRFFDVF